MSKDDSYFVRKLVNNFCPITRRGLAPAADKIVVHQLDGTQVCADRAAFERHIGKILKDSGGGVSKAYHEAATFNRRAVGSDSGRIYEKTDSASFSVQRFHDNLKKMHSVRRACNNLRKSRICLQMADGPQIIGLLTGLDLQAREIIGEKKGKKALATVAA